MLSFSLRPDRCDIQKWQKSLKREEIRSNWSFGVVTVVALVALDSIKKLGFSECFR